MKKLAIALCLTASVLTALGQGSLNFNNRVTAAGVDAPVTLAGTGAGVMGPDFVAQLYVLNPSSGSLEAVGSPAAFRTTAAGAGYLSAGTVTVSFLAPGADATVMMKAWAAADGASFEDAFAAKGTVGQSGSFTVALGGAGTPPSTPADLVGLQSFQVQAVPEPSTIALGLLGLAALALRRRK